MITRFKRCVLHIGTEKTGTTSFQAFLHLNRAALLARGIFVPASLSPYRSLANHERLTTYALNADKLRDDLRLAAGLQTIEAVEEHRTRVAKALEDEISDLGRSVDTLLLSNEHCHSRLVRQEEVSRLCSFLANFVDSVVVIVYLRPQYQLATSLYDQALRAGYHDIGLLPSFDPARRQYVTKQYFDYWDLTSRWASVFSEGNLRVRIFSEKDLIGSDIITDLMSQVGDGAEGLKRPPKQNVSVGADYQPVLNAVNRIIARRGIKFDALARNRLIAMLREISLSPARQPSRGEAREFMAQFMETNEAVRKVYFPGRLELFDLDFAHLPEASIAEVPEVEALVETLIRFITESKREVPRGKSETA